MSPTFRGVLARILRVGVDATDREINAGEYGAAPDGSEILVLGHESFGRVEEVGPEVTELVPGDYVVFMVRRPGGSIYDRIGQQDFTTDDTYFERGISRRHGYLTEKVVDDAECVDLMIEATGFSPLVFEAMERLGKNGVLVLTGIAGGNRKADMVHADHILQSFVLGNKVDVGSVNAARVDFERGVSDLAMAESFWPGWLSRLLTHPIDGLENYAEMIRLLTEAKDAIKVYVDVRNGRG